MEAATVVAGSVAVAMEMAVRVAAGSVEMVARKAEPMELAALGVE